MGINPGAERNELGQWPIVEVFVIDGDDGSERLYYIRDADKDTWLDLIDAIDEAEADESDVYGPSKIGGV